MVLEGQKEGFNFHWYELLLDSFYYCTESGRGGGKIDSHLNRDSVLNLTIHIDSQFVFYDKKSWIDFLSWPQESIRIELRGTKDSHP